MWLCGPSSMHGGLIVELLTHGGQGLPCHARTENWGAVEGDLLPMPNRACAEKLAFNCYCTSGSPCFLHACMPPCSWCTSFHPCMIPQDCLYILPCLEWVQPTCTTTYHAQMYHYPNPQNRRISNPIGWHDQQATHTLTPGTPQHRAEECTSPECIYVDMGRSRAGNLSPTPYAMYILLLHPFPQPCSAPMLLCAPSFRTCSRSHFSAPMLLCALKQMRMSGMVRSWPCKLTSMSNLTWVMRLNVVQHPTGAGLQC